MAKQYKKILKKIHPKKKSEKVGRDYLLLAVMGLTFMFMIVGWTNFTIVNKILYVALAVTLSATYARRHYNFTENQDTWAMRISYAAIAVATVAFVIEIYQQFIA